MLAETAATRSVRARADRTATPPTTPDGDVGDADHFARAMADVGPSIRIPRARAHGPAPGRETSATPPPGRDIQDANGDSEASFCRLRSWTDLREHHPSASDAEGCSVFPWRDRAAAEWIRTKILEGNGEIAVVN